MRTLISRPRGLPLPQRHGPSSRSPPLWLSRHPQQRRQGRQGRPPPPPLWWPTCLRRCRRLRRCLPQLPPLHQLHRWVGLRPVHRMHHRLARDACSVQPSLLLHAYGLRCLQHTCTVPPHTHDVYCLFCRPGALGLAPCLLRILRPSLRGARQGLHPLGAATRPEVHSWQRAWQYGCFPGIGYGARPSSSLGLVGCKAQGVGEGRLWAIVEP